MNNAEFNSRIAQAYRQLAWRIMVYLKANPDILDANNNQEIFAAVREIQIKYYLEQTPKYTREDSEAFVDLMSELEAKKYGQTYFVEQQEMELYRSCIKKDRVREAIFMLTLLCYDTDCYTKEVHEMVMAEEAEETKKKLKLN